jgi:PAS domain S-box-containing protein
MQVLFVTGPGFPEEASALQELRWLEPALEIEPVEGVTSALALLREEHQYRAVFLAPSLPANEALALIASLRRDRAPVAIIAIINESNSQFFPQALAAGADDVLWLRPDGPAAAEDTLHRIRHSRHAEPSGDQASLRVLYAGDDDQAWSLLQELAFAQAERTVCAADGSVVRALPDPDSGHLSIDVLIVDDTPGDAHTLQVVKWAAGRVPDLPVVVLTAATADLAGAAVDLGAEDVIPKVGTYRRRLVSALYRLYLRRALGRAAVATSDPRVPHADPQVEALRLAEDRIAQLADELGSTQEALVALRYQHRRTDEALQAERAARERAEAALTATTATSSSLEPLQVRCAQLEAEARDAAAELSALRQQHEQLTEAQGFERALRERDRADLAALRQSLAEERERRQDALRQREADLAERESQWERTRQALEAEVATGQGRIEELTRALEALEARPAPVAEARGPACRDEFWMDHPIAGYAVLDLEGRLLTCNSAFATMFGYANAEDACEDARDAAFAGLPDHTRLRDLLDSGHALPNFESTVRRTDGRSFRVLTSARLLPATDVMPTRIERTFIDHSDRLDLEEQLRLSRRLEAAGRLAAEMSPLIEAGLSEIAPAEGPDAERRAKPPVVTLVRQLLAFSRRQARPAGYLSLNDTLTRSRALLGQVAGDAVGLEIVTGDVEPVAAGEADLEQVLAETVFALASCLPFGGTLRLEAAPVTADFVLRTQLVATAAGYGVQPLSVPPSLTRTIARCGGSAHIGGEAGRTSTLHIIFPR